MNQKETADEENLIAVSGGLKKSICQEGAVRYGRFSPIV